MEQETSLFKLGDKLLLNIEGITSLTFRTKKTGDGDKLELNIHMMKFDHRKINMGLGDKIKSVGKSAKEQAVFSALSPAMQLINGWTKDIHPENDIAKFIEEKYGILFETQSAEETNGVKKGKVSILYQPRDIRSSDFNRVCEIVYNTGNFALFVDEAFKVCNPSWIEPWHEQIMTLGRER